MERIKRFKLIYLLTFAVLLIFACSPKVAGIDKNIDRLPDCLMWKISGNGLEQESFLFGTVHLIEDEDYFLPKGLLTALDKSDQVVFEVDMREMNDMSSMMKILPKLNMAGDTTLKDLFTAAEYEEIEAFFNEKGLPLAFMQKIKPMFLAMFASFDEMPTQGSGGFGLEGMKSYEMEILELAESAGKDVGGVETLEYQIGVFDVISLKEQADYLLETIRVAEGGVNDEVFKLYKSQDIEAMANSISNEGGVMVDELLVKRNTNWIPIMQEKMKDNIILFAVGAGHLGGKKGVIRLLMEEGYTLTPIQ